mmetsp:Transcript_28048/g.75977  ORF Transcript_28048/g.75977 Transcript_28048/m.75977 type:complete len:106 (-) Transcript_28048:584-901(-)
MDFFKTSAEPPQPSGPSAFDVAKTDAWQYQDEFQRLSVSCFKKCVSAQKHPYNEGDMSLGEMQCVDRCVAKYVETKKQLLETHNRVHTAAQTQAEVQKGLVGGAK